MKVPAALPPRALNPQAAGKGFQYIQYMQYIHCARNLLLLKWKMSQKGPHIRKGPTELSEIGICLHLSHVKITQLV